MTSQNKYNDPGEVEQYSFEYLQNLKAEGLNEEITRLHNAGHFRLAIEEQSAARSALPNYKSRSKGVSQAGSIKSLTEKQEAEQAASKAVLADRKREALATLRRLGVNPEDLR